MGKEKMSQREKIADLIYNHGIIKPRNDALLFADKILSLISADQEAYKKEVLELAKVEIAAKEAKLQEDYIPKSELASEEELANG